MSTSAATAATATATATAAGHRSTTGNSTAITTRAVSSSQRVHRVTPRSSAHRIWIHGLAVSIRNYAPLLDAALRRAVAEFEVNAFPAGLTATEGTLRHYDKQDVLKHLSPSATPVIAPRDGLELYRESERFWLIDDRWGLVEMNLLKGQWKAWILSEPNVDLDRVIELAVTWPMSQLLRAKGLHLLPAASVVRANWGMLLVSPFPIEPELTSLLHCGFRLLGQRWSALREESSRIAMLHVPGRIERLAQPRLRNVGPGAAGAASIDLEAEFPGAAIGQGSCDTVVLIEPGRRPTPHLRRIPTHNALPALRRAWPIVELHPNRLNGQLASKLSRRCQVYSARLSQRPQDLLEQLESLRARDFAARAESAAIKQTARSLDTVLARSLAQTHAASPASSPAYVPRS